MAITPLTSPYKGLTFDGVSSLTYGVQIFGEGVFNAPKRDVEMVKIPGRNGTFALDNGRFENITVTYPANIIAGNTTDFAQAISDFRNQLCSRKGYCRLSDDYHTDEYRMAVYKSGLEVDEKVLRTGEFTITFDCKPQRWLVSGESEITIGEWSEYETATGDIVEIEAEATDSVKSLTVDLEPIQDLNGYDKPWSGGNGKNKLPNVYSGGSSQTTSGITYTNNDGVVKVSGTPTGNAYYILFPNTDGQRLSLKAGTYTISCAETTANCKVNFTVVGVASSVLNGNQHSYTFTASSDAEMYANILTDGSSAVNLSLHIQIESGSTASSWTPYSNICPISGHTDVVVSRTGKNLLPLNVNSYSGNGVTISESDGYVHIVANGASGYPFTKVMEIPSGLPSGAYYVKSSEAVTGVQYRLIDRTVSPPAQFPIAQSGWVNIENNGNLILEIAITGSQLANGTYDIGVGLMPSDIAYEPYQGDTYTTSLGTTVYGGTLDVVSGVLTVTDGNIASYNGETLPSTWISDRDVYASGTTPTTGAQVVYKLATPTTTTLTAQQIDLLLGTNNIWADTGDVTLEYGQNPNVVINPTLFESSPLLEIKGYGSIEFNGYDVQIENVPYGEIQLTNAVIPTVTTSYTKTFDTSHLVAGDSIYFRDEALSVVDELDATVKGFRNWTVTSQTNISEAYGSIGLTQREIYFYVKPDLTSGFTYGTASTINSSASFTYSFKDESRSETVSVSFVYDGNDSVTVTASRTGTLPSTNVTRKSTYNVYLHPIYAYSTEPLINDYVYCDTDIGEFYRIEDGQIISMNHVGDLGSKLPTLASGANAITYDNTITDLKIQPRWWKV